MVEVDEANEAYEKLKNFMEKELSGFDYGIIASLAGKSKEGGYRSVSFILTSIKDETSFIVVRMLVSGIATHFNNFINRYYNIGQQQPLFKSDKNEKKDE